MIRGCIMPRSCRRALRLRYILARGRNVLYKRAYENERRREGESKGNMRSARAKMGALFREESCCAARCFSSDFHRYTMD